MRDPGALAPDIRAQLEAENAYTLGLMADTEELQQQLFAEMKGRIKEDDSSVPAPDGSFSYYTRFVTGGQHPLFCRLPRGGGDEQILIDGNALAKNHAYFRISNVAHSPDHRLIAYAVDTKGSEFCTVHVVEAPTGAVIDSHIADNNGSFEWASDSQTLLYVWLDDEHRPRKVLSHAIGADGQDALVHEQPDPAYFLGLSETQSRRFLLLNASDHETAEIRLVDTKEPIGCAASRQRARTRSRLFRRASRRSADHPHQFGWRRGLPHRRGADRDPRPRALARDRAASSRPSHSRDRGLQEPSRAARARGRACRASSFAASPTAQSMRSPSPKKPTPSASRRATSTTRPRSASPIRR